MFRNRMIYSLLWFATMGVGCCSIHSTHVKRNEDTCGWDTTHLRGIPITLDVPATFKVEIVETQYYHKTGKVVSNSTDGKPVITRNVFITVQNKKEIFTVDFIKPGAGQLTTGVDLDSTAQYFSEINNKITDTTIDSITAAINTIGGSISPLIGGKSSGFTPASITDLTAIDKTVAVGVFDVNDRHALEKVHVFLCQHLNGCTPPCIPNGLQFIGGGANHSERAAPSPNIGGEVEFPPAPRPVRMPPGTDKRE